MYAKVIAVVLAFSFFSFGTSADGAGPASTGTELSVGIVPQQTPNRLAQIWAPLLAHLSKVTGYTLRLKTAKDISTFERRLAEGEYDLAYLNPYHYAAYSTQPGYQVFAAEKGARLSGIIVVRKDSAVRAIDDLAGFAVAMPAPTAFAASVLIRSELKANGVLVTPKYAASHDSVYRAVAMGLYPAGGGVARTLASMDPEIRDQLRVLWSTRDYAPHAIAAHPRVPNRAVRRLQQALLALGSEPEGRALLAAIHFQGVRVAHDSEYDTVRALQRAEAAARVPQLSKINP